MKKTVVIGASTNPNRYSYLAVNKLLAYGHPVYAAGIENGNINGVEIDTEKKIIEDIHTVTLYVAPRNQPYWFDYIFALQPKRIILNPGTENDELEERAINNGIEVITACTLVMLSVDNY